MTNIGITNGILTNQQGIFLVFLFNNYVKLKRINILTSTTHTQKTKMKNLTTI